MIFADLSILITYQGIESAQIHIYWEDKQKCQNYQSQNRVNLNTFLGHNFVGFVFIRAIFLALFSVEF